MKLPAHIDAIQRESLLTPHASHHEQMSRLVDLLLDAQKIMNLTAIREAEKIVRYHLADSIALDACFSELPPNTVAGRPSSAADIGTGGGFPLLPMAIIWPETKWTGIESIAKKAAFVQRAAKELGLLNATCLTDRAENVGQGRDRSSFDLVTSRAVGPVASLLEVSLPLLKTGGILALFKTEAAISEWRQSTGFLKLLGGRAIGEWKYSLEGDEQQRAIFLAQKTADTPDRFPRANGLPFKKPYVAGTHPR